MPSIIDNMISLREKGATGFEVEVLFRSLLQDHQIYFIDKLLRVVGQYAVLDKKIIDARLKKPMQLKYITKAIRCALINQYRQGDNHYYTLAPGGIYFLEQTKALFILKLPLNASHFGKARVLTFNYWALDKELEPIQFSPDFNWVMTVPTDKTKKIKKVVCYFMDGNLQEIREELYWNIVRIQQSKLKAEERENYVNPGREIVDEQFDFKVIDSEIIKYSPKSEINKIVTDEEFESLIDG